MSSSSADIVRVGIADLRGDGRPDYAYNGWVLYADTVAPERLPAAGGPIVIHGMGFRLVDTVLVGGHPALVTSVSPTEITAIAPPGGRGHHRVCRRGGRRPAHLLRSSSNSRRRQLRLRRRRRAHADHCALGHDSHRRACCVHSCRAGTRPVSGGRRHGDLHSRERSGHARVRCAGVPGHGRGRRARHNECGSDE